MEHTVLVRHTSGGYATFKCPLCEEKAGLYKKSAAAGWCEKCKAQFVYCGGKTSGFIISTGRFTYMPLHDA